MAESDSLDAESGFDETEHQADQMVAFIAKFVKTFIDKVCTEGGVTPDHIKALHSMIPGNILLYFSSTR